MILPPTPSARAWLRAPASRACAALLLVLILGACFNADGAFFSAATHRDTIRAVAVYGILACGMTLVVVAGGIDLAVGSVLGLASVGFSLSAIHWGWSAWLAIPATLAVGAAMGTASGVLIAGFRLQPFIATLAMMVFARGVAKWASSGEKISTTVAASDGSFTNLPLPAVFELLNSRIIGGSVAVVSIVLLICVVGCWLLLARFRFGRHLYAIGGNEEAARLSGVPVLRVKLIAYALCGALAAVAGVCQAGQEMQGDPEAGSTYELTAIAMVVIGGTSLAGGRGGILLTLIGTLTIGYLEKILSINAVGEAARLMLTGVIVVGAVLLQRSRR